MGTPCAFDSFAFVVCPPGLSVHPPSPATLLGASEKVKNYRSTSETEFGIPSIYCRQSAASFALYFRKLNSRNFNFGYYNNLLFFFGAIIYPLRF